MKREFIKRVVLETIQKKAMEIGSKEAVEIHLTPNDFWDSFSNSPIIFFSDIPETIIELETDTQGKISLVSPLPVKTGDPLYSPVPDYYRISYDSNAKPKEKAGVKDDLFLFYLSKSEGLYRIFSGKKETYAVNRADQRFSILENLTRDFQTTEALAQAVGTIPKKLRPQIAGLKKQIEDRFDGIKGEDFIDGKQGEGYRLGKKITLKHRE